MDKQKVEEVKDSIRRTVARGTMPDPDPELEESMDQFLEALGKSSKNAKPEK